MAVYGIEEGMITRDTIPTPKSNYGKAKFEAEEKLVELQNDMFAVAIMRPPMVYGNGCKGNYQSLVKYAKIMPIFPDYKNKRSMINIERLCWFVKQIVDHQSDGLFFPQDESYICTCQMVQKIAEEHGKKMFMLRALNPFVSLVKIFTKKGKKAFGDLYYEMIETNWK